MTKDLPPVLLAAMALELGGAETHVISLARELKRRGYTVVVASAGGRMVSLLNESAIPHVQVPMDSRSPVTLFRAYRRLSQVIDEYQIGLVHAHARIPAWLTSLALRRRPIPFVTTYHGVYNAGFPWRFLTVFGQRTIAVSADVQRHLVERLGADSSQIRQVLNGFDTNQFRPELDLTPLLAEFGVGTSGRHLVSAGRLDEDLVSVPLALLKALPEIDRQIPGIRLWILGDGNQADQVRRLTEETNRQLGREAAVATGTRLDVPLFFNLADCVVAVARTAVEAMACERPVIIAGQGGYRGILTPDKIEEYAAANFTAREGGVSPDPAQLAADVVHLLRPESAELCRQMGAAGRAYVTENLSIERITDKIVDVYAEVL